MTTSRRRRQQRRQRGKPSPLLRKQTRQGAPPLAIGVGVAVALGSQRGLRT